LLNLPIFASPYFDCDAFVHHALHLLDIPEVQYQRELFPKEGVTRLAYHREGAYPDTQNRAICLNSKRPTMHKRALSTITRLTVHIIIPTWHNQSHQHQLVATINSLTGCMSGMPILLRGP